MIELLQDKITKQEMIDMITPHLEELKVEKIKRNDSKEVILKYFKRAIRLKILNKKELYEEFGDRLALHPINVEEILSITKLERKRWTDEGKLIVVKTEMFTKYGKDFECPYYDYKQVHSLKSSKIEKWREDHKKKVSKNRLTGAKKAVKTRDKNNAIIDNFYNTELVGMKEKWNQVDEELFVTFNLAFWTMWCSRMAKQFQEKAHNAVKKANEYNTKKEYFYKLKNTAIDMLLDSKYTKLSFYRPEDPDKIYISFCDNHYEDWCEQRRWGYMDKWDYYYLNRDRVDNCKNCNVDREKDYYSLYYLDISHNELSDIKFSFHTPYPIATDKFPHPNKLKKVHHKENQEGLFRFGRSLVDEEVIVFTDKKIEKYLLEALDLFDKVISSNTNENTENTDM